MIPNAADRDVLNVVHDEARPFYREPASDTASDDLGFWWVDLGCGD
jgi:hypothetical protein